MSFHLRLDFRGEFFEAAWRAGAGAPAKGKRHEGARVAGIALVFPGQGSQAVGMGKALAVAFPEAARVFEEANAALGFDLMRLCGEGPEDQLTLTYNAQAAILTVSTLCHRVLAQRVSIAPVCLAGHSLGEYSALVAAGALSFSDAVKAVYQRGKFMQEATPLGVGAMAAILGAEPEELERICQEEAGGQVVSPANFNAPGQITISGHAEAVKRVLARCKGKLLTVSAPFHCALMAPAAERMREVLAAVRFSDARQPVCTNVDNAFLTRAADFAPALVRQITAPVRWDTGVKAMIAKGAERFIELGHGRVLAGLIKRIDKAIPIINVQDEETLKAALTELGA
jgi:[acyl-carrier-protein] S-malonyltransferase